jgi:Zn-dependent protease
MTEIFLALPVLLFSVIFHEVAHGWTALKLGDPTAARLGRLTMDPRPHIDPVMSLLVPAICILGGAPIFGGAKPVPVNPSYFRRPSRDMAFVALAGPLSNLLLAFIFATGINLIQANGWMTAMLGGSIEIVAKVFSYGVFINLILAAFNLLPIPPLDGSRVLAHFLKGQTARSFRNLDRYGMFLILAVIIFLRAPLYNYLYWFYKAFSGIFL